MSIDRAPRALQGLRPAHADRQADQREPLLHAPLRRVVDVRSIVPTLSMEIALRIWTAHREIEAGKQLLSDIRAALKEGQLGVPSGDNSHRLLDVSPRLAVHIIEAHIAEKQRELEEASIAARVEMDSAP